MPRLNESIVSGIIFKQDQSFGTESSNEKMALEIVQYVINIQVMFLDWVAQHLRVYVLHSTCQHSTRMSNRAMSAFEWYLQAWFRGIMVIGYY